jgi:hypothetical protein
MTIVTVRPDAYSTGFSEAKTGALASAAHASHPARGNNLDMGNLLLKSFHHTANRAGKATLLNPDHRAGAAHLNVQNNKKAGLQD